jgi:hypothetical protein
MIVSLLSAGFASCGGDDEENTNSTNNFVGTWLGYRYDKIDEPEYDRAIKFIFKSNGTGDFVETDNGVNGRSHSGAFTYKIDTPQKCKILFENMAEYEYFIELYDNRMFVYDKDYGNDLDYILTKQ